MDPHVLRRKPVSVSVTDGLREQSSGAGLRASEEEVWSWARELGFLTNSLTMLRPQVWRPPSRTKG